MQPPADDRYEFQRLLGESPGARVWLARDRARGGAHVAVKEFRDPAEGLANRLRAEWHDRAHVAHPGLATLHNLSDDPATPPRIVTEFVDGRTAADLVRTHDAGAIVVPAAEALRVLDWLDGCDHCHGGLTPGNLLVRETARAAYRTALLDGGALSTTTTTAAALPYLAPERLDGGPASIAGDVYALGVLLFEALHGRTPYRVREGGADAWRATIEAGRRVRPAAPDPLPAELTAWLDDLMHPDPATRPTPHAALARLATIAGAALAEETATGTAARLTGSTATLRADAVRALWDQLSLSRDPRLVWVCGAASDERGRLLRGVATEARRRGWLVTLAAGDDDGAAVATFLAEHDEDARRPRLLVLPHFTRAAGTAHAALLRALRSGGNPAVRIVAGVDAERLVDPRIGRLLARAGRGPSLRRIDLGPLDDAAVATLTRRCGSTLAAKELASAADGNADRVATMLIAGNPGATLADAADRLRSELTADTVKWLTTGAGERGAAEEAVAAGLAFALDGDARPVGGPTLAHMTGSAAGTDDEPSATREVAAPVVASGIAAGLAALASETPTAAAERLERLRLDATSGDDIDGELRAGIALGVAHGLAGRHGDALVAARRAAELAARLGDLDAVAEARAVQALSLARCGRTSEAEMLLDVPRTQLGPAARATTGLAAIEVARIGARPDALRGDDDAETTEPHGRAWRTMLELEGLALAGDDGFGAAHAAFTERARNQGPWSAPHWVLRADLAALRRESHAGDAAATGRTARAFFDRARQDYPALAAEAAAIGAEALRSGRRVKDAQALAADGRRTLDIAAERVGDGALRAGFLERRAFTALREGAAGAQRRLQALYEMSRALNSESDPEALLAAILDMALDVVSAERGMILLRGDDGEFTVRLARNLERQTVADAEKFSRNVAMRAGEGRPVLAVDTGTDERVRDFKSVSVFGIRSVLCVPLRSRGEIVGVVYLDSRAEGAPFTADDLDFLEAFADHAALALENARSRRRLERDNERLQVTAEAKAHFGNIIGESEPMREVFTLIEKFAASDLPVLVQGASGTGKELVARAVHFNSDRRKRAFITENCAAIPETLLQSELFGHVRGAFTGADRDRPGLFEQADGGTLFLDEVGDMSAGMQAQLLRALQDGEVRRVGADRPTRVDVRVIAATHRDLQAAADTGGFRSDLLYRLQVLTVQVPPLCERGDDIATLAGHFVARIARERGRAAPAIDPDLLTFLRDYPWPGNVRQLENVLQRLSLLAGDNALTRELVEEDPWLGRVLNATPAPAATAGSLAQSERDRIREALEASGGNRAKAARMLGISRATIYRKIGELEL